MRSQRKAAVWFGLGIIISALIADYRERGDFAFWLHLFGLMAFWGGITATESSSDAAKVLYCLLNVGLLLLAIILMRRTYAVFGVIGISIYCLDYSGRAVVHVDGPDAMDLQHSPS